MNILGISAHYHDSAAALVQDGKLIAAAQEERFTRKKHDAGFPQHAIEFCLRAGRLPLSDIDYVAFYDRPSMKFRRLLSTYLSYAPRGLGSYLRAMPLWLRDKLYQRSEIRARLATIAEIEPHRVPPVLCAAHHQSHAASAFFPSPFEQAAVLCMDGVGEWATTSAWSGEGASLTPLWEIRFPHSIGLLYSAFTFYTGFRVNSGEYKLMGLAPYGEPRYVDVIRERHK
jgi:carbamoyltransferase